MTASREDETLRRARRNAGRPTRARPQPAAVQRALGRVPLPAEDNPAAAESRSESRETTIENQRPTGLEGSPLERQARQFLNVVRAEVVAWRRFTTTWTGETPGPVAFRAAAALAHDGIAERSPEDTGIHGPATTGNIDARLQTFIRRNGRDLFAAVREMVSWQVGTGQALAELFDIRPVVIRHKYVLHVHTTTGRVGETANASMAVRRMRIVYTNSLNMRFESPVVGVNAAVGAAPSLSAGEGGGGGIESETSWSESDAEHPLNFHAPEWFRTRYLVAAAQAQAGGGVGGRAHGIGASFSGGITRISFQGGDGRELSFHFADTSVSVGGTRGEHTPGRIGVGLGVDLGAGHAFGSGTPSGRRDPPPPDEQPRVVRDDETQVVASADVFFASGRNDVDGAGQRALDQLLARVQRLLREHPDAQVESSATADASPRWAGARNEAEADGNNQALAQRRAENTLAALRAGIARMSGRPPEGNVHDSIAVQNRGAEAARQTFGRDRDPQAWRRVHVEVRGSVYRRADPTEH